MAMSCRLALMVACASLGAATAADPVPKSPALPAPLPTKDGVRLAVADGSGPTREDALKAAYAAAVRQVADSFVATELLTGGDDKVLAETIRTAANAVVSEGKELSVTKEGNEWRARVVARVAPLKLLNQLQAAKVPVKAVAAVDGESEFAKAASRLEAGKAAAAWFAFLLRDYPFGCYKTEVIAQWEDKKLTTETTLVWNVHVRHTLDLVAYKKVADLLAESLEHLSIHPSDRFKYTVVAYSDRPGNYRSKSEGTTFSSLTQKLRDRHQDAFLVSLATADTGKSVVVVDGREKYPGTRYEVSGRCYVLDKAVRAPFTATVERGVSTRVMLNDKDGKVVAQKTLGWRLWGPMPLIDGEGYAPFAICNIHPFPSNNSTDLGGVNHLRRRAPYHDTVYTVEVPLADIRRVTKTEVEIVVGR